MPTEPWWKSAVVYQIYPRSFSQSAGGAEARRQRIAAEVAAGNYPEGTLADSNGDGVGDLEGIRQRLDHLSWLGIDAIWLSPFFTSPMADFGYDVSDYCDVDPVFGDLAALDALVADCHERDIKVVIDWVPNHTSDQHPWFLEARESRDSAKRDWYVWRDPNPDGSPPNNWRASFADDEPAWTFDEATGQWYLHLFLPEQPDVNWDHPEVEAAMHDVLRFWLDRGVDGFRADVLHAIGKFPDLDDDADELIPIPHSALNHVPEVTLPRLRRLRDLLDSYDGDRMMVGEVYLLDTDMVALYYDEGRGIHLSFNFPPLHAPWTAAAWRHNIEQVERSISPVGWPTWVLSNHDVPRHRTRYGSEARARAAAFLTLGLRGTPFLYAGEELGLEDGVIPDSRVVDPGGRDGCRSPIPWDAGADHGWGVEDPWLPWPPGAGDGHDAESIRADDASIVHLYRRLLAARRATPALTVGDQRLLHGGDDVVAWERDLDGDRRVIAVAFGETPSTIDLDGEWVVEVSSDGAGEGDPFTGAMSPDSAVLLRPARS